MKFTRIVGVAIVALSLLTVPGLSSEEAGESAWFDLENCAFCKNLAAEEGLMAHMDWEIHMIGSGMMSVGLVPDAFRDKFMNARKNMQAVGARMMQGEKLPTCGFCASYGALVMAGSTVEEFETAAGHISLITSDDPELVKMIQAHGQRTLDEYATWKKSMHAGHDGDHGHGH